MKPLPLSALATGDANAYRVVYDFYYLRVGSICMRIIRDEQQAKDCLQEVFTMLWIKREQFCKADEFERYFIRATVHRAILWAQDEQKRKRNESQAALRKPIAIDGHEQAHERHLARITTKVIHEVLLDSSQSQRRIYVYLLNTGMSAGDIAQRVDTSISTVYNTVTQLSKRIREKLGPHLGY